MVFGFRAVYQQGDACPRGRGRSRGSGELGRTSEAATRWAVGEKEDQKAEGKAIMDDRPLNRPGARMAPRSGGQGSGRNREKGPDPIVFGTEIA